MPNWMQKTEILRDKRIVFPLDDWTDSQWHQFLESESGMGHAVNGHYVEVYRHEKSGHDHDMELIDVDREMVDSFSEYLIVMKSKNVCAYKLIDGKALEQMNTAEDILGDDAEHVLAEEGGQAASYDVEMLRELRRKRERQQAQDKKKSSRDERREVKTHDQVKQRKKVQKGKRNAQAPMTLGDLVVQLTSGQLETVYLANRGVVASGMVGINAQRLTQAYSLIGTVSGGAFMTKNELRETATTKLQNMFTAIQEQQQAQMTRSPFVAPKPPQAKG